MYFLWSNLMNDLLCFMNNFIYFCDHYSKALNENAWIGQINMDNGLSLTHLLEFVELWSKLQDIQLLPGIRAAVRWKFTDNGIYSISTAYKMQFDVLIKSDMPRLVWKFQCIQLTSY